MRLLGTLPIAAGLLLSSSGLALSADVVIGVPSWSSAIATAHVLKVILEKKFDLEVALENGSNEEIFAAMDRGEMDIHPEVWLPNHAAMNAEYVLRRKSVVMSQKGVPANQGICATQTTVDEFGIASVSDLTDPEKVKVLDTDANGKGEMWIGASDWTSTRIERIRAKGYGYAETMDLLEGEEDVAVTAVDAATAAGKPIVFYCYQPHHVFELHDVVFLEEPPYDPRKWSVVDPSKDDEWLAKSSAAVAWPPSFFHINYSKKLEDGHPDVAAFLSAVSLDVDTVGQMTYALVVERRDPDEFATEWVASNQDRIGGWLANAEK